MRRRRTGASRVAMLGTAVLVLGASMLAASLVVGGATSPAFADTAPYELYCPSTPVGNIVLNDVVTTGSLDPANPSGRPFGVANFQVQLTVPADVVSALQSMGATAIAGSYSTSIGVIGADAVTVSAGPFTFDVPIPPAASSSGVALHIPPSPASFTGGFAPPETVPPEFTVPPSQVSVSARAPSLTVDLPGGPFSVTCAVYPNDTIATSGITTQTPTASTIAPVIAHATPGPPDIGPGPHYLALGDSVPMWNGGQSYPYDIAFNYPADRSLDLEDLACSGETTSSMLSGPTCAPSPYTSQMQEALAFLQQYGSNTALITIDIGGNDVVGCVSSTGIDQQCVTNAVATMTTNLKSILTQLQQAAPSVPIIAMNYFDPFLGDWLAGGATQATALQTVSALSTFNGVLSQIYSQFNVQVADVFDAFQTSDLTDMVSSQWGTVPVAVNDACMWLDITCTAGQSEGFGDDPNVTGATVIAGSFEKVIGSSFPSPPTTSTTSSTTSSTSTSTSTSSTTTSSTTTSTSTTTTSTTTPTTTSTSTTSTSTTSTSTPTTSSTSTTSAASATTDVTPTSGSPPSSSKVVTAPSSSLAFTGTSPALRMVGYAGVGGIVIGVVLLLLVDVPHRLARRLSVLSRRGSRSGAG